MTSPLPGSSLRPRARGALGLLALGALASCAAPSQKEAAPATATEPAAPRGQAADSPALAPPPPPPAVAAPSPPPEARSAGKAVGSATAPQSVEEALAVIDRAQVEIDRALARPAGGTQPGQPQSAADTGSTCGRACAALASMGRATGVLCSLVGPSDGRCTAARDRVRVDEARLRASCPACSP